MAEGELHKRLVRHLADTLVARGDDVRAVDAAGHPKPEKVRRWPWSKFWFRPDVETRRGRLRVYGDAKRNATDVRDCLGQIGVLTVLSRELVICVPEAELQATAQVLDEAWGLRHFGRLRLLGDESSELRPLDDLL